MKRTRPNSSQLMVKSPMSCGTIAAVRTRARIATGWLLLLLATAASPQVLPKPQITSAQGKLAPDFTLKDQLGRKFSLGSLRGKRVLLIFYRGYW